MSTPVTPPRLLENLFAPEVFATEVAYLGVEGGNVKVTFTSTRFDNSVTPGVPVRVVIGRLVMPAAGARGFAAGLFDFLTKNNMASGLTPPSPTDVN